MHFFQALSHFLVIIVILVMQFLSVFYCSIYRFMRHPKSDKPHEEISRKFLIIRKFCLLEKS